MSPNPKSSSAFYRISINAGDELVAAFSRTSKRSSLLIRDISPGPGYGLASRSKVILLDLSIDEIINQKNKSDLIKMVAKDLSQPSYDILRDRIDLVLGNYEH